MANQRLKSKRALNIRLVVYLIVALWCAWSLRHYRDRDLFDVLREQAAPTLSEAQDSKGDSEARIKRLEGKLAEVEDKTSSEYTQLEKQIESAKAEAEQYGKRLTRFENMMVKATEYRDTGKSAPFRSVLDAADDVNLRLTDYIEMQEDPDAGNKAVLAKVYRQCLGTIKLGLDLRGGTEFVVSFKETSRDEPAPEPAGPEPAETAEAEPAEPAQGEETEPEEVAEAPAAAEEDVSDKERERRRERELRGLQHKVMEILRNRVDRFGIAEPEIKPVGRSSVSIRLPGVTETEKELYRNQIKAAAVLEFRLVDPNNNTKVMEWQADPDTFQPSFGYEPKPREMVGERDGETFKQLLFLRSVPEPLSGRDVVFARATPNEFGNWTIILRFNLRGAGEFARVTGDNVGERLAILLDGKVYSAPSIRERIGQGQAEISGSFTSQEARVLAGVIESGDLPVEITLDSEFGTDPTLGQDSIKSGIRAALGGMLLVVLFVLGYYRFPGLIAVLALAVNILLIMGTVSLAGITLTLPGIAGIVLTIGMAVDANVLIFERLRGQQRAKASAGVKWETSRGPWRSLALLMSHTRTSLAARRAAAGGKRGYKKRKISGGEPQSIHVASYDRAFVTIFDANVTTLLTAIILYVFSTGPVRGFSATLGVGIVFSMFTALFMTRTIFDRINWWPPDVLKGLLGMRSFFKKDPNFPILKYSRAAAIGSITVIVLVLLAALAREADKESPGILSIDFAGGTVVTYTYNTEADLPEVSEIRKLLDDNGYKNCRIGWKDSATRELRLLEIVLPGRSTNEAATGLTGADAAGALAALDLDRLRATLNETFDGLSFQHVATSSVGSLIGAEFRWKALLAAVLAAIAIVCYISWRFRFGYGIAAVAALIHDVVIAAGVYLVWPGERQLSMTSLAALLTIMGYSLNDTIVVFDRIREQKNEQAGRTVGGKAKGIADDAKFSDVVNTSINNTLSRTLLTSLTTLLVVVTLWLFGGGAINDFAVVMMVGVVVGTYSSIFVASSLVAYIHHNHPRLV